MLLALSANLSMNRPPNLFVNILLYTLGVFLVMAAVLLVLRGVGWLAQIPDYVIGAMILLAIGVGILGGLRSSS